MDDVRPGFLLSGHLDRWEEPFEAERRIAARAGGGAALLGGGQRHRWSGPIHGGSRMPERMGGLRANWGFCIKNARRRPTELTGERQQGWWRAGKGEGEVGRRFNYYLGNGSENRLNGMLWSWRLPGIEAMYDRRSWTLGASSGTIYAAIKRTNSAEEKNAGCRIRPYAGP